MGTIKDKLSGIGRWVEFTIREKKLVYAAVFFLAALGIFGLTKMNKDEFPSFEIKQGLVAGIYPGASAAEVEQQLTKPLEETLFSFKEVRRANVHSISRDGICYIYVDLNVEQTKKDEVWSKIKLGLQTRKLTLPTGVLAIAVLDDFSNVSSMLISLESDDKNIIELQDYAEDICEHLRTIPTLAKASVVGVQKEEIAVTLDRDKLSLYGIDPSTLLLNYRAASLPLSAGSFNTSYISAPIHIQAPVEDEQSVSNHIIYSDPSGKILRLGDVATIERRLMSPDNFVSYNGNSCIIVNVEMRPGNNIVEFGRTVRAELDKCTVGLPESVRLDFISDQPKVVNTSVWSFLRDLIIAMLVVIFVMLLLFPMRSALIAGSGVPVCTAIALAFMYIFRMEVNTVTLAALIVVLGMIVDDSIITMDGYMDKMSRGLTGIRAAAASAGELFMPTFIATLAICLMFFPAKYIISDYLGDFIKSFPWVILIALMISLFYAVSVVPSLEVKFITPQTANRSNAFTRAQNRFFSHIQKLYDGAQEWCFRHHRATIAFGVGAVALGLVMFSMLSIQMMPMADREYFVVEMYLEAGNGLPKTKEYADSLTSMLLKDRRVESVTAFVGTGAPRFSATYTPMLPSENTAQLIVNTVSNKATMDLLREYENRYEFIFPEARLRYKQISYQPCDAPIVVQYTGEDRDALALAAARTADYMRTMSDVLKWVHTDIQDLQPAVNISLDPDEAGRLGISKAMLALSLSGTFNGQTISEIWDNGHSLPVNIYSEGIDDDMDYSAIGNQKIASAIPGRSVPLRQIARVAPEWNYAELNRICGTPTVSASADLKTGCSQPAAEKKIKEYVKKEIEPTLPEGVSVAYNGLSTANRKVIPEIAFSFIAAIAILFLFLLIHFKRTSIAIMTMCISTLCLFGATLGLLVFQLDFSMTAVLGLISLVGIIVRNSILMFDYAEEARFVRGADVMTAAMEAGKRRMRPIFLTSCTTALGVLPMIISDDKLWKPMGVVICFGTLLSIILITLIMPISYWRIFRNK